MVLLDQSTPRRHSYGPHHILPKASALEAKRGNTEGKTAAAGPNRDRSLPALRYMPAACPSMGRHDIPLERWQSHRTTSALSYTLCGLPRSAVLEAGISDCSSSHFQKTCGQRGYVAIILKWIHYDDICVLQ